MSFDKAALKEMMLDTEDKKVLKAFFKELLLEEPQFFKKIILEILEENKVIVSDEQAERRVRLKAATKKVFDKYDDVFKALA